MSTHIHSNISPYTAEQRYAQQQLDGSQIQFSLKKSSHQALHLQQQQSIHEKNINNSNNLENLHHEEINSERGKTHWNLLHDLERVKSQLDYGLKHQKKMVLVQNKKKKVLKVQQVANL